MQVLILYKLHRTSKVRLIVRYLSTNSHEFLNSILSIVTKKLQTLVNKNPELVDVN